MIEAGEMDVALDELRWLLSGCGEFIAAHVLLGKVGVPGTICLSPVGTMAPATNSACKP